MSGLHIVAVPEHPVHWWLIALPSDCHAPPSREKATHPSQFLSLENSGQLLAS